jgi:hypothetical protein
MNRIKPWRRLSQPVISQRRSETRALGADNLADDVLGDGIRF